MAEHLSGYADGGPEPDTPFLVSCAEQSLAPLASWDCFICKEPSVLLPWRNELAAHPHISNAGHLRANILPRQQQFGPTCSVPTEQSLCPKGSIRRALSLANKPGEIREEDIPFGKQFNTNNPSSQMLFSL